MTTSRTVGVGFCLVVGISLLTTRPFQAAKPAEELRRKPGMPSETAGLSPCLREQSVGQDSLLRTDRVIHPLGKRRLRGEESAFWRQLALRDKPTLDRGTDSKGGAGVRVDLYGDPLPPGAIARLGTLRLRHLPYAERVAWTPDGKVLVSASGADVILWDIRTGKQTRKLEVQAPLPGQERRSGRLTAVAFSRTGGYLALGLSRNRVHVWDLHSGKLLGPYGKPSETRAIAFHPDGRTLVVAEYPGIVRWWDLTQGKELQRLDLGKRPFFCVALSPDGKRLAAECDGRILLWDLGKRKQAHVLDGEHRGLIHQLAFVPDGRSLVSCSRDTTCVWNVSNGKRLCHLPALQREMAPPSFSPDSSLVVGPKGDKLGVWEVRTGKELYTVPLPHGAYSVALSPDRSIVAAVNRGRTVIDLWEVKSGKQLQKRPGHRERIDALAFSPDGKLIASAGDGIRLWDVSRATQLRLIGRRESSVSSLAFSPDGKLLLSGGSQALDDFRAKGYWNLCLWDLKTGKELRRFVGHANWVTSVAFGPRGKLAASASDDHTVRLWEVTTGKELRQFGEFSHSMYAVAFSPDGKTLAAGGEESTLHLWDVSSGKVLRRIKQERATRTCVFSPDGKYLASGSDDGWVRVWGLRSGKAHRSFAAPPEGFYRDRMKCLVFSPNGRTLASIDDRHLVRLWEVLTARERATIGHYAHSVAFSPDGRRLATGGEDTTILVWDVASRARGGGVQPMAVTLAHLQTCWEDLACTDAKRAFRALGILVGIPSQTVPFFVKRLLPPDTTAIRSLIAGLDDSRFSIRVKAFRKLEALGDAAEPVLRQALAGRPSLELRQRVEQLLAKLEAPMPPERLRRLRALEILEYINTREAKELLDRLRGRQRPLEEGGQKKSGPVAR